MTVLLFILTVMLQVGACFTGALAYQEAGLWMPDKGKRNRRAFACLVLSVAALLTARLT